jgi:putative oxidoreductase
VSPRIDLSLFAIRTVLGIVFIAHGAQKWFIVGLPGTVANFGEVAIPIPEIVAPTVATLEILTGVAVIVGLLTRLASLFLTGISLVALFAVHRSAGFFVAYGGYEYVLVLAVMSAAVVLSGAGRYSVDAVIVGKFARRSGTELPRR